MFYSLIIDFNRSWSPRFSVWKTNQLWNLLQITSFSLNPLKKTVNCTSQYYRSKEKVCPFGPSRMPTQRHFSLQSFLKSKHLMLSKQLSYATNTWHILIKTPCHLSSRHNFSFFPVDKTAAGWRNKLCHTLFGTTHTQKLTGTGYLGSL